MQDDIKNTSKKISGRGGSNRGQGRKSTVPKEKVSLYLPTEQIQQVDALPGSRNEHYKAAMDMYLANIKKPQ